VAELYFAQSYHRTSVASSKPHAGKQADFVAARDRQKSHVTAVRRLFLVTFSEPGDLQSVHYPYLATNAQGRWRRYGWAWAGDTLNRRQLCSGGLLCVHRALRALQPRYPPASRAQADALGGVRYSRSTLLVSTGKMPRTKCS